LRILFLECDSWVVADGELNAQLDFSDDMLLTNLFSFSVLRFENSDYIILKIISSNLKITIKIRFAWSA
jgi:hypothetical protein